MTIRQRLRQRWGLGYVIVGIGCVLLIQIIAGYAFDRRVITTDSLRPMQALFAQRAQNVKDVPIVTPARVRALHALFTAVSSVIRMIGVALLLQGVLLVMRRPIPLAHAMKASILAALVLAVGQVAHVIRLLRIVGPIPTKELTSMPFSLGSVFDGRQVLSAPLVALLNRVTVFECAWVVVVTMALVWAGEKRRVSLTAAATCWFILTVGQWVIVDSLPRALGS